MTSFLEQQSRRPNALISPVEFYAAVTTSTTVYTGRENEFLLLRKLAVVNTTGSAVALTLTGGGNTWVNGQSVAANATLSIDGVEGLLLKDEADLVGSGTGLSVFGWGLRIQGGAENWTL